MVLTKLVIVFENCEESEIDARDIRDFHCSDISKSITLSGDGNIIETDFCKDMELVIRKSAKENPVVMAGVVGNLTLFDRINEYRDIVSVEIYTEDNKNSDTIYVPWSEKSDYSNNWQQNYYDMNGDLNILIKRMYNK